MRTTLEIEHGVLDRGLFFLSVLPQMPMEPMVFSFRNLLFFSINDLELNKADLKLQIMLTGPRFDQYLLHFA